MVFVALIATSAAGGPADAAERAATVAGLSVIVWSNESARLRKR